MSLTHDTRPRVTELPPRPMPVQRPEQFAQPHIRNPEHQVPTHELEELARNVKALTSAPPLSQIAQIMRRLSYGDMMEMATMLVKTERGTATTPENVAAWLHHWATEEMAPLQPSVLAADNE